MNKAIIGKKLGMTQIFSADGKVIPVTVVEAGPCPVVQLKTVEKDGYQAIKLGFNEVKEAELNKPEAGQFKKAGAKISGPIPLPTEKEIVTILRSPHKYKDSREQFEIRTHKRLIDIYSTNAKILDSIHLPAGVDVKIKL